MSDNYNINTKSDDAIMSTIGAFIKHHRLQQNKTQDRLAKEAGINRSTLLEFEKGTRVNLITFIQLLRALNLLHFLDQFKIVQQISPMQLAELEEKKRKRASKTKEINKNKSDW